MSARKVFPTIPQAFLNRVRTQPDRRVLFTKEGGEWKGITWKEYFDLVSRISLGLAELGVAPGENVCLISNTRMEWLAADMAILGARAVTVPVYASNTPEETAYIIGHCGARVVFVEDARQLDKVLSVLDKLPEVKHVVAFALSGTRELADRKDVMSLAALRELGARAKDPGAFERNIMALKPADVFTICYTSGTTGVPKGVVLTQDSLTSVIDDVDKILGKWAGERDTILSFLPASHIFGKVESMALYHFGWRVYFAESLDKILLNLAEVAPTLMFAVPRIFEKAYNKIKAALDEAPASKRRLVTWALGAGRAYYASVWAGKRPTVAATAAYLVAKTLVFKKIYAKFGGRIRFCLAGGAPLPKEIGEFMRIIGISILEGYGLTETCAPVTINAVESPKFGSIGKPLPEVSLKIAEDGEILVRSRKVFREYYKSPEATREVKEPNGWFHTGDIGVIDEDGFVRITDRKKDLIVTSGGKNIAPQKIEGLAKTHKYINQFVVHGDKRNFLSALVVLEKEEVIKYAKENNILFSEYGELIKHSKVQNLVQNILDEVNSHLASFETIKRFRILPNDFSIESGELTPSLKIKRRYCSEKYKAELDSMYGTAALS